MIRYLLLILLTAATLAARSQDTSYYDKDGKQVAASSLYDSYSVRISDPQDSAQATVRSFYRSGKPETIAHYSDYQKKILDGVYEQYYQDGTLHILAHYKQGRLDGELKSYRDNGKLKRDDFFSNDHFVRGKCFDAGGRTVTHTPWSVTAEFPGGIPALMSYLSRNIRYPRVARKKQIEGEVLLSFVIERDGRVGEVTVIRHVAPEIDAEAVKVVSHMPRWRPGLLDDEPVTVEDTLPIRFRLTDKNPARRF